MRRTGLELSTALAVLSVIAAASVAWSYGLPLRDPDGAPGPTIIRLPAMILLALLIDVIPRIIIRAEGWRDARRTAGIVARERWTPANLRFTFIGLAGWYATYAAIRNLKGFVPVVNHNLYDNDLDRIDRTIFLGHRPAVLLHDALGTGFAAHVLSFFYLGWIFALPISLAIVLVWVRRARVGTWWITAVSIDWIIGVVINFSLPTLGPVYERPSEFADLAHTKTAALQQSMMDDRIQVLVNPAHAHFVQNIAAFASLHVAIAMSACVVAHRAGLRRWIVWALRAFLLITMIDTVYFGWHYVSDVIAGLLLGIAGAWLAERFAATDHGEETPDDVSAGSELRAPNLAGGRPRK
ncbi:MAG: inositol phosphorylceramide synthase [Aeromicrobium sp.]|nr:inositol phosphorylceramide synthase [Aeromicrobium sp.]